MKIEYTLKEVRPNIFAVVVPNDYDRAMLFCRVQEFYESDSDLFKEQDFSIWDYMKWYSDKNKGIFTYTKDWEGYNVPFSKAINCIIGAECESPYDKTMQDILDQILITDNSADAYIIGVKSDKGQTFKHELCHALYHTKKHYKIIADAVSGLYIIDNVYIKIRSNLLELGYNEDVIPDEIQAYMMTNYKARYFSKGVNMSVLDEISKQYKQQLNKYIK